MYNIKNLTFWQVGVKAPGIAKITCFPFPKAACVLTLFPGFPSYRSTFGMASPTYITIMKQELCH